MTPSHVRQAMISRSSGAQAAGSAEPTRQRAYAASGAGRESIASSAWCISAWTVCQVLASLGCGPGNPLGRLPISGQVTLDGEPLNDGAIQFAPAENDRPGSGAPILNGRFSIDELHGLPPGQYRVMIFSPDSAQPDPMEPAGGAAGDFIPPSTERIPVRYNIDTTLEIEVIEDGPNDFEFTLDAS